MKRSRGLDDSEAQFRISQYGSGSKIYSRALIASLIACYFLSPRLQVTFVTTSETFGNKLKPTSFKLEN